MNLRLPWNRPTLTDRDREVLAEIDGILGGAATPESETGPLGFFTARMAAAAPHPNASFASSLESRLLALADQQRRRFRRSTSLRRAAIGVAALGALAVGTALAMPALGLPTPSLFDQHARRVAPEVVTSPSFPTGPSLAITPPPAQWTDPAQLSAQLGLALYVPAYLPPGCDPVSNWGTRPPLPHVAYLRYGCVQVTVYALDVAIRPQVAAGSVEELVVAGRPATLITGVWSESPDGQSFWYGDPVQLFIEEPDVTVGLRFNMQSLGREELVRLAESLRPIARNK